MRILMVKTSSMGDVIHTLPALTDAQQAIPGLCVDWVVEEGFAQIPSWHSAVDRVIPIAIRRWRKNLLSAQTRQEWRSFKQRLHQERYDAVIDAQDYLKVRCWSPAMPTVSATDLIAAAPESRWPACFTTGAIALPAISMRWKEPASWLRRAWAIPCQCSAATTPSHVISPNSSPWMPASTWCFYMPPPVMRNTGQRRTGVS